MEVLGFMVVCPHIMSMKFCGSWRLFSLISNPETILDNFVKTVYKAYDIHFRFGLFWL